MDVNTGSSQNFYVLCATIAMALFVSARGIETLRAFSATTEHFLHMRALAIQAGIAAVGAMLPLALSGLQACVSISSYSLFGFATAALLRFVYQIVRRSITVHYKTATIASLIVAALGLLTIFANAVYFKSSELYKIAMLLYIAIICLRFYLIVGLVLKPKDLDH